LSRFGLHLEAFGSNFDLALIRFGNISRVEARVGNLRFLAK